MDAAMYKERVRRLKELDKVIKSLDPAIREASFKLLQPYVTGSKADTESGDGGGSEVDTTSAEQFFTQFQHDKPAENAVLIAAFFYGQYGAAAFSMDEVRETADQVGLTIPSRVDMTYQQGKRKGKALFNRAGRGQFRPTVHGEQFFKETYSVKKGKKQKPAGGDQ